jgi:hypothetical protein
MFELCYKINTFLENYCEKWFICGGWSLDLFIGNETRKHNDIEIGIFRKDQVKLFDYFKEIEFHYVDNVHNYRNINWKGELLNLPIHELHCKIGDMDLEILLNECDENNWIFRRDNKIKVKLNEAIKFYDNIPYLSPELVLLYKLNSIREKDEFDFKSIVPKISKEKIYWLKKIAEENKCNIIEKLLGKKIKTANQHTTGR